MAKLLAKRRKSQEKIPVLRGSSSPESLLYLRAIQGHSGGKHIDPTLQDSVLLPDDFAEHIYHVGNCHDLHSIILSGLIPGGKSIKIEKHAVFFTAVNPMFVDQHKEVEYDLTTPRIAVYNKHWKIHQSTMYWCNLTVPQKNRLQFYQTRSNAIVFHNTLPAICIEKVVNMKSGEELYNKVYQSPRLQRKAVLKPNLHHGRQDLPNLEGRTSVDHQSKVSEEYGETRSEEFGDTRCGNIDFRIQGPPHSTFQKQDDSRRETVKKMIHQFETHPNRESVMADLSKNQKFNLFSEKPKELIRSMGNTVYFEMCEIISKEQCQDCLLYWEMWALYTVLAVHACDLLRRIAS